MIKIKPAVYLHRNIKEAIDNLPGGLCFFGEDGLILLCNRTMYRLSFAITGRDLQSFSEFRESLRELPENTAAVKEGDTFLLSDGTAWNISFTDVTGDHGEAYTQALAADVTELYHAGKELQQNIESLNETGEMIRKLTKNLAAAAREKEILALKMQIHDELGSDLLKLQKYYRNPEKESKEELLAAWKKTLGMLSAGNTEKESKDPLTDLLHSAGTIGVDIIKKGELPEDPHMARLLVRAVRECLTNAVRHARADTVYVTFSQTEEAFRAQITNDGEPPAEKITEGGGLSSLRSLVEMEGGHMKTAASPVFALTIELPVNRKERMI